MQKIAEKYNSYGLKVLPVKKDKTPASVTWKEGIDPARFNGAWGIAVVCGGQSGNLEVLDFDNHQGDARERITAFQKECEVWPDDIVVVKTGGGGYHILYRCNKIGGNQKLASVPIKNSTGREVPDAVIETRGEGGYAVTAPSQGYKVVKGCLSSIPTIPEDVRSDMIEVARGFNRWVEVRHEPVEDKGRPGDIYNQSPEAIDEAKDALKEAGWAHVYGNRWRRPGKNKGHSATFGTIAQNILYAFSPNAYPFEQYKCYTPFQIVALLRHGGDFKKFAGELAEKYTTPTGAAKAPVESLLRKARVDLSKPVMKPPVVMTVREMGTTSYRDVRMFTLGNFSAVTGKAKSKKTFFLNMLASVMIDNRMFYEKFTPKVPENKKHTVYFDTEQGDYDVYNSARRISLLAGGYRNFEMYQLREFEPTQRCNMIEEYLRENPQVGFVIIDGVADLGIANNDEEASIKVVSLLMRWTKQYNCHIVNVLHQNKGDNHATGHLGSYIMKKAEIIISVTKDKDDRDMSIVNCEMSRGPDFDKFVFRINEEGLPELAENPSSAADEFEEPPF
jgi:hypothetical protein